MSFNVKSLFVGVAFATAAFSMPAQAATKVDVELSLLIDVSGSVSTAEFVLQRDGYVNAFKNSAIQNAITDTSNGRSGAIAVNLIYWASSAVESIPFTLIDSTASANAFADAITAKARPFGGNTGPGTAINFAVPLFALNDFDGDVQVIDVSGDGVRNTGADTATARDNALLAGVDRINGIAIGSQSILDFYTDNIIGGTNSFALLASDFTDFEGAIAKKLRAEITGTNPTNPIPLPAAAWLLISGVVALGAVGRRRRAAA